MRKQRERERERESDRERPPVHGEEDRGRKSEKEKGDGEGASRDRSGVGEDRERRYEMEKRCSLLRNLPERRSKFSPVYKSARHFKTRGSGRGWGGGGTRLAIVACSHHLPLFSRFLPPSSRFECTWSHSFSSSPFVSLSLSVSLVCTRCLTESCTRESRRTRANASGA